jgi:hypothetical protein
MERYARIIIPRVTSSHRRSRIENAVSITAEFSLFRFPNEFIAVGTKANEGRVVKGSPPPAAQRALDNMVLFCYSDFAMNLFGEQGKPLFE